MVHRRPSPKLSDLGEMLCGSQKLNMPLEFVGKSIVTICERSREDSADKSFW